jgi:hypothetical protein
MLGPISRRSLRIRCERGRRAAVETPTTMARGTIAGRMKLQSPIVGDIAERVPFARHPRRRR